MLTYSGLTLGAFLVRVRNGDDAQQRQRKARLRAAPVHTEHGRVSRVACRVRVASASLCSAETELSETCGAFYLSF